MIKANAGSPDLLTHTGPACVFKVSRNPGSVSHDISSEISPLVFQAKEKYEGKLDDGPEF